MLLAYGKGQRDRSPVGRGLHDNSMDYLDDLLGERSPRPRWLELAAELEASAVNDRRERRALEPSAPDVKRLHAPLKVVRSTAKPSKRRKKR